MMTLVFQAPLQQVSLDVQEGATDPIGREIRGTPTTTGHHKTKSQSFIHKLPRATSSKHIPK